VGTVYHGTRLEVVGNAPDVHRKESSPETSVAEATLGHLPEQRHLPALKPQPDGTTGTRLLSLVALA